ADEMKDDDAFKDWLSGEHPEIPVPFGESQAAFNERVCSCFAGLIDGIIK
ncbi:MAG TPA: histidine phosphatase family protein, partial [Ruminococcaceae bacterium]|nr:histidine phosphatase family protein [Oscillospiraceae bacterium]